MHCFVLVVHRRSGLRRTLLSFRGLTRHIHSFLLFRCTGSPCFAGGCDNFILPFRVLVLVFFLCARFTPAPAARTPYTSILVKLSTLSRLFRLEDFLE